jgi:hypothetical protein
MEYNDIDYYNANSQTYINDVKNYLAEEILIYRSGDSISYVELVRDQGKLSLCEHDMNETLSECNDASITHRGTEFLIDATGHYPMIAHYFDLYLKIKQLISEFTNLIFNV